MRFKKSGTGPHLNVLAIEPGIQVSTGGTSKSTFQRTSGAFNKRKSIQDRLSGIN